MSDTEVNIFEKASRLSLTFTTPQGTVGVSDLWTLPLRSDNSTKANLNDIAKGLNRLVQQSATEEFVDVPGRTVAQDKNALSLEIVKRVITVRQAENAAKIEAQSVAENKARQRELLQNLIEQKKTTALGEQTVEQLQAQLDALG